ncbi:MAG: GNAT family protein [Planctomycetota bacterium]
MPAHRTEAATRQPDSPAAPMTSGRPVRVHVEHGRHETAGEQRPAEIVTPRLRLRPLGTSDREAFIAAVERSHDHLEPFLPLAGPDRPASEIFDRQLALTQEGDATGKAFRRIAIETETGRIAGAFNLIVIRRGLEMEADTSVWLADGFTGKGLAAEGFAALLSYSFADLPDGLGLHRIDGFIDPRNTPSKSLASRLGFEPIDGAETHLTVGERWSLHERWSLTIDRWLRDFG